MKAETAGKTDSFEPGRRYFALCSDGKTRSALLTRYADTYFTVPAVVSVRGKSVSGFVWFDGETLKFTASAGMKNTALLPDWKD